VCGSHSSAAVDVVYWVVKPRGLTSRHQLFGETAISIFILNTTSTKKNWLPHQDSPPEEMLEDLLCLKIDHGLFLPTTLFHAVTLRIYALYCEESVVK
jgi:hypothetical protein